MFLPSSNVADFENAVFLGANHDICFFTKTPSVKPSLQMFPYLFIIEDIIYHRSFYVCLWNSYTGELLIFRLGSSFYFDEEEESVKKETGKPDNCVVQKCSWVAKEHGLHPRTDQVLKMTALEHISKRPASQTKGLSIYFEVRGRKICQMGIEPKHTTHSPLLFGPRMSMCGYGHWGLLRKSPSADKCH